jgi:hypothetical protein
MIAVSVLAIIIDVFLLKGNNLLVTIFALILLCILFPILIIYDENKEILSGLFFVETGLAAYHKNTLIAKLTWDDIELFEVKTLFKIKNSMFIKVSSRENPNKVFFLHVTWFVEKSVIELTKKYVPESHALYKKITEYAKKRNITF